MPSLGERELLAKGVHFTAHAYDYRKKGAQAASEALGLDVAATVKTLVVRLDEGRFVFLLVPGGMDASLRSLARQAGSRGAELACERDAQRLTGYQVGGIGPFGARTRLPVYMERSLMDFPEVYVNGGRRGLLLGLAPKDLAEASSAVVLDVSRPPEA